MYIICCTIVKFTSIVLYCGFSVLAVKYTNNEICLRNDEVIFFKLVFYLVYFYLVFTR